MNPKSNQRSAPLDYSLGVDSYTIYCHTHIESGRRYVGLTKHTMMKRWNRHVYNAIKREEKTYFANTIRKYGKDAFSHEVLEICYSLEVANLAEECWIEFFGTRNSEKGFNIMKGGSTRKTRPSNAYRSDPSFKARVSTNSKRLWQDPTFRSKVISTSQAITTSQPFRTAMSEKVKELWQDSIFREKNLSAVAASYTPERIEQSRRRWDNLDYRKRCSSGAQTSNEERRMAPICKRGHTREINSDASSGWARECHQCAYDRRRSTRTHCPQGHTYAADNIRLRTNGTRICLTCEALKSAPKPCAKCGLAKTRKSGAKFRCGPCTDARVALWKLQY